MKSKILAAIDLGTNSFHLVIAKVNDKGMFKILLKEKEVVRLGELSNDMKYLSPEAVDRGISALKRFKLICDSVKAEKIRAVATSAIREAINNKTFLERAEKEVGLKIEIVSGFEEGRLIYLGVLQALPVFKKRILLVDIGGGSTEFLVGCKGQINFVDSIKIGSVRLTQKFFRNKKFKDTQIEETRLYVKSLLNPVIRDISKHNYSMVVGTSGTIVNVGTMIYAEENIYDPDTFNFNNFKYDNKQFQFLLKKIIKAETVSKISSIPGLDPRRADIITAGAIILEQILSELKISEIALSSYALREGIILDTINKEHDGIQIGNLDNIRYRSIINLAENCNYDKLHTEHVLKLSEKIFDFLKNHSYLEEKDKEYLEAAVLLHDIGHNISHTMHHRHSYYLIRNSELLGFNDEEIEIIANIARYHRKSHPKLKHEGYSRLTFESRDKVNKLAGILRISDGLDRGHNAVVKDIELFIKNNIFTVKTVTVNNISPVLEIWGANMRKGLFEESFKLQVKIF